VVDGRGRKTVSCRRNNSVDGPPKNSLSSFVHTAQATKGQRNCNNGVRIAKPSVANKQKYNLRERRENGGEKKMYCPYFSFCRNKTR